MALYLIGDVQGCDAPLARLLHKIDFSPSRDTLYLLGDLVNRGPDSDAVLRRLMGYGASARCLLGNHDLSLLAVAAGFRTPHPGDTVDRVLQAPDREALLEWLRQQPLAMHEHGLLMVHAGVLPQWDADQVMALAGEVEAARRSIGLDGDARVVVCVSRLRWEKGIDILIRALPAVLRAFPGAVLVVAGGLAAVLAAAVVVAILLGRWSDRHDRPIEPLAAWSVLSIDRDLTMKIRLASRSSMLTSSRYRGDASFSM